MSADEPLSRDDSSLEEVDGTAEHTSSADPWRRAAVDALVDELTEIVRDADRFEDRFADLLGNVHPDVVRSARNLLHYLALRNVDRRPLQKRLARLGLSSLGRAEGHVLASLHAVLGTLHRGTGNRYPSPDRSVIDFGEGADLLQRHTAALLGERGDGRDVRIMVTLSREAASSYRHVRKLIEAGMDCARINCARNNREEWAEMVAHVRKAAEESGSSCRIVMDLGGPKLRTGPLEAGPRVTSWDPSLDLEGRIAAPALVWLGKAAEKPPRALSIDAAVPLESSLVGEAELGDRIVFRDTRGRRRRLTIVGMRQSGVWAAAVEPAHIETGSRIELRRREGRRYTEVTSRTVGELPPRDRPIILHVGDTLVLHADQVPGRPAVRDEEGVVIEPAVISCSVPDVMQDLKAGETIKFNDGKIGGIVREASAEAVHVEITQARPRGSKLRGDRSINVPDSDLGVSGLTQKDISDLDFVARHADAVGLSFVREPSDIRMLQEALAERDAEDLGIMLKIETRRGFQQLPLLLLTAMGSYPVGVMIARGDLAVECGWERLAEVQEEILWLAEAAHVPVVWATQVLENLAKRGFPSRAEITDAAMAQRAECVMLNKGPHIIETMHTLDDILRRMQAHQSKKTATLRSLLIARMNP